MSKKNKGWIIIWGTLISLLLLSGGALAGSGKFYIVGMGTTPDLMTIRAAQCVKQADIIILSEEWDQAAWKNLIAGKEVWFLGHSSQVFYGVDPLTLKNPVAREKAMRLAKQRGEMIDKIKDAVKKGKIVASLQWGDPMIYGITYPLEMLPKDFPSEIIPGVGAFQAASAAVKMSPPYGWDTSSVILTMTDWSGRADTNEKLMATQTSMIFYTMHLNYPKLFEQLKRHYPQDTPVAVVNHAGDRERQKVITSTVGRFLDEVNYQELPVEGHMLLVGKFLKVGQARKEGLAGGKGYIEERHNGVLHGEKK
jgi:precorrin-4/cobalt-precorrin-4 C11-methyltransferase